MTEKQIQKIKDELHYKHYGNKCAWWENEICPWTDDELVLQHELMCREMINSMLIYGDKFPKGSYNYNRYLKKFIVGDIWMKDHLLTEARVDELIKEQKADFAKAEVGFAGYDGEGVSYNYCKWADD